MDGERENRPLRSPCWWWPWPRSVAFIQQDLVVLSRKTPEVGGVRLGGERCETASDCYDEGAVVKKRRIENDRVPTFWIFVCDLLVLVLGSRGGLVVVDLVVEGRHQWLLPNALALV